MKFPYLGLAVTLIMLSCAKNDGAGSIVRETQVPPLSCFNIIEDDRGPVLASYSNATHCPKNVMIPENLGIRVIESKAFQNRQLTKLEIPNTVVRIKDEAFNNNHFKVVRFPSSVTYIGKMAFASNSLLWLDIPGNVKFIGANAFSNNPFPTDTPSVCIENPIGFRAQYRNIAPNAFPNGVNAVYKVSCAK